MEIDVSIGEVLDKITILSIKLEKFKDESKISNVKKEYELLASKLKHVGINSNSKEFEDLKNINLKIWDIEDNIRIKESKKEFDDEFIKLARSVYFENDERARLKKEINLSRSSELIEEKEYVDYKQGSITESE